MGKKGLKGRRRVKLKDRRDAIVKEFTKIKRKSRGDQIQKERSEKKKKEKILRESVIPYHPKQNILILGDGDFSFTKGLLEKWLEVYGDNESSRKGFLLTTCLETKKSLYEKYPTAQENVKTIRRSDDLKRFNVEVLTKVDGTNLDEHEEKITKMAEGFGFKKEDEVDFFDRIIFNFPHLGSGETDKEKSIKMHQELISNVALSCHDYLSNKGELHITVKKGEPYRSWKLSALLERTKLYKTKNCTPFVPQLYPGYTHKRTVGAAFKSPSEGGPIPNADIDKLGAHTFVFSKVPTALEQ